ncbi:MAG: hypothetical protein LBR79_03975 [Oscillospiraceae bacterium]|nr:hypothetical protein [Oscillospiraceae bacterium]
MTHYPKSTTAYEDTSQEILMQSHFLSDAFFGSLRSVRFTDRSTFFQRSNYTTFLILFLSKIFASPHLSRLCSKLVDNIFLPADSRGKKKGFQLF